jgi:hypothetical protein
VLKKPFCPVLDRVPVGEPGVAGLEHDDAEPLLVLMRVLVELACDELVVELSQGQVETNFPNIAGYRMRDPVRFTLP